MDDEPRENLDFLPQHHVRFHPKFKQLVGYQNGENDGEGFFHQGITVSGDQGFRI
jgi:hypothetical protein